MDRTFVTRRTLSHWHAFGLGAIAASILSFYLMLGIDVATSSPANWSHAEAFPVLSLFSAAAMIGLACWSYPRLPHRSRQRLFFLGYLLGATWVSRHTAYWASLHALALAEILLTRLACWHFWGTPVQQDGTLCPHCAYSLTGNESGRCPECGMLRKET